MITLDDIVKDYKTTKNSIIMKVILLKLDKILTKKSKYIYNRYKKHISNIYEADDIKQELIIFVYKIIDKYEIGKSFMSYFLANIWHYKPNFLRTTLKKKENLPLYLTHTESIFDNEGNLREIAAKNENNQNINFNIFDNKLYNKILNILYNNPKITQIEMAKQLKVSRNTVIRAIAEIRKKITNKKARWDE